MSPKTYDTSDICFQEHMTLVTYVSHFIIVQLNQMFNSSLLKLWIHLFIDYSSPPFGNSSTMFKHGCTWNAFLLKTKKIA